LLTQRGDFLEDAVQAFAEQLGQLLALAAATFLELLQRLVEQLECALVERLRIERIADQHTRPAEHLQRIDGGRLADQRGNAFSGGDQLAGALLVDLQVAALAFLREAQGAFHLAARESFAQGIAHLAFEVAKGFRQAQVRLQIAMIDRADFPTEGAMGAGLLAAGKGRHAVDHRVNLSDAGCERRRIVKETGNRCRDDRTVATLSRPRGSIMPLTFFSSRTYP